MPSRRQTLSASLAAGLVLVAMPSLAAAERDNPMPEDLRRDLERDPAAPVLGNPNGDVTLTEFFDYNCGFCRRMVGTMQQLIASDPNLRVVFRELPIFGQGSQFAARAALAALDQGKYWQVHAALMGTRGRVDETSTMRAARQVGLDQARLRRDMESDRVFNQIEMTLLLADHMGLRGTPTFIAGDEAAFGAMDLSDLQALVARARKTLGIT